MSEIKVPEDLKVDLGKLVIEAALDDTERQKLSKDPKSKIRDIALDDEGNPAIKIPDEVRLVVLQNTRYQEFLVLPDREMVQQQLADLGNYEFPPAGYLPPHPDDNEENYRYRVGDYVLAQCG